MPEIAQKLVESLISMDANAQPTPRSNPMSAQRSLFSQDAPAPVSICALADEALKQTLEQDGRFQGIIVGNLHTENLGIEHIINYCLQNPEIRFILVCGEDGQQAIGHLAGQSFIALGENGINEQSVIIGAQGKRPVLKNISTEAVAHFRQNVTLLNHIGETQPDILWEVVQQCVANNPGPAEAFNGPQTLETNPTVVTLQGWLPEKLHCDKAGYFVIRLERDTQSLALEHYQTNGTLATILHGKSGPEVYHAAIECGLVSRLDHAAYLGRELQRAEFALESGEEYVQDAKHGQEQD